MQGSFRVVARRHKQQLIGKSLKCSIVEEEVDENKEGAFHVEFIKSQNLSDLQLQMIEINPYRISQYLIYITC